METEKEHEPTPELRIKAIPTATGRFGVAVLCVWVIEGQEYKSLQMLPVELARAEFNTADEAMAQGTIWTAAQLR